MLPNYDYNHMNTDRWMKFWYAVDQLYEWVHDRKTIDATTLQQLISAYYHSVKHIDKTSTNEVGKGARQRYTEAGLLDTASDYHANLYKHFRDAQQEHFSLSDEEIGSEELAVLALLGLRAGAAAPGGAGDEDAEEQLEGSEFEEGASVYNAYSESEIQSGHKRLLTGTRAAVAAMCPCCCTVCRS
jgi:hypothetical protein